MRRLLTAGLVLALSAAGVAYGAASDADLEALAAELRADEVAFEQTRDDLDAIVRANTRPLFRSLLVPLTNCATVADCRTQASRALDVLARPGPADSVAKTLHTTTRQAGAQATQAMRRHIAEVEGLIANGG